MQLQWQYTDVCLINIWKLPEKKDLINETESCGGSKIRVISEGREGGLRKRA